MYNHKFTHDPAGGVLYALPPSRRIFAVFFKPFSGPSSFSQCGLPVPPGDLAISATFSTN